MYGYIYKTTNLLNGKIYIGQHKASTFDASYFGSGKIFNKVLKKHGKKNFICEILEWCETREIINDREIYYIDKYKAKDPEIGYNLADGGNYWSCDYHQGMLGKKQSEYQKKIAKEVNSHPLSLNIRKKMSESAKKRTLNRKTINNKCFIHKDDLQTCVDINQVDNYIKQGWIKGRIPKNNEQKELIKNKYSESIYINKDKKTILINKQDLEKYLNEGYSLGKAAYSETRNKNVSNGKKGKIAITNFIHTKYINKEDFPKYEILGYIKGNLENIKRKEKAQLNRKQG